MAKDKATFFTDEEVSVLVDLYTKYSKILLGTFQGAAGGNIKKRKWAEILEAVNAVGNNNRTLDHIKKKIKNIKQNVKGAAAGNNKSLRKTGGGEDDDLPPDSNESKILSTISKRQIYGIPGGFDVHGDEIPLIESETKPQIKITAAVAGSSAGSTSSAGTDQISLKIEETSVKKDIDPEAGSGTGSTSASADQLPLGPELAETSNSITLFHRNVLRDNEEMEFEFDPDSGIDINSVKMKFDSKVEPETPKSSKFLNSTSRNLTQKRKSSFEDGPQTKIMREQVSAVHEQVQSFKNIETILGDLVEIERQKLQFMKDFGAFAMQWMKDNSTPRFSMDDLD